MADSELSIKNRALKLNGARKIGLGEQSKNADTIDLWYLPSIRTLLSACKWSFATTSAMLSVTTSIAPAWVKNGASNVYLKPTGVIKVFDKYPTDAVVYEENIEGKPVYLTNTETFGIRYTFLNDNPETYFDEFTEALVYKLATNSCYDITGSTSKSLELNKLYEEVYKPVAMSSNSQIDEPDDLECDYWLDGKYSGGFGTYGTKTTT